jgi:ribosomal-protein-alanine N-acetyltransferase
MAGRPAVSMSDVRFPVRAGIYLSSLRFADRPTLSQYLRTQDIYATLSTTSRPYAEGMMTRWINRLPAPLGHVTNLGLDVARAWSRLGTGSDKPFLLAIRDAQVGLIGTVGANGAPTAGLSVEVGAWLAKPYWGRGIMTDAMGVYVRYAFGELQVHKLFAHVLRSNPAAVRFLEKSGFKREGYLRQQYVKDGRAVDAYVYGLVREDLAGPWE